MRIVIAGAGAIGGYVGARLALTGADVVLLARGPHLQAMQERGLRVISPDGDFVVAPRVAGEVAARGPADVVMLGVKAHSLPELAPQLRPLFKPETFVVSMQNGIPWWYFDREGGELSGHRIERVDPGGVIAAAIESERIVGSVVYLSAEIVEPGVIRHASGHRIIVGEPDGEQSERCQKLSEVLISAGFRCPITPKIRHEIWIKLLGNVAFNPVSALTRGSMVDIVRDPDVGRLARDLMRETEAVAAKLGVELPVSIEQRMAGAEKVGSHKTSMLQDLETGRPMEVEAILGAVIEIGDRFGVPMPALRAVYACTKLLDAQAARRKASAAARQ